MLRLSSGRVTLSLREGRVQLRHGGPSCLPKRQVAPVRRRAAVRAKAAPAEDKLVWVEPTSADVLKAAQAAGYKTALTRQETEPELLQSLESSGLEALQLQASAITTGQEEEVIGRVFHVRSGDDMAFALSQLEVASGLTLVDLPDDGNLIIPAESFVGAAEASRATVLVPAYGVDQAKALYQALEKGPGGLVLRFKEPQALTDFAEWLEARRSSSSSTLSLETARVTRVEPAGMADRVCVDLTSLLEPGWGLLVGSFARALFLVHSECLPSDYISSRPFRVNAGPVHSYVAAPGGRTAYLSELRSGAEVLAVNARGEARAAVVGRAKVERRPMVLVEAENEHGTHSIILQSAETVRLVAPRQGSGGATSHDAKPVTELKRGDSLLLLRQGGARHTGMSVDEFILEQ